MNSALLETLPRKHREMVTSAGYRVKRWAAARQLLQTRVVKGRIKGPPGDFLSHWLDLTPDPLPDEVFHLSFRAATDAISLVNGGGHWLESPLERALLHLPALRQFWSRELRQRHFEELKATVPRAWLLDSEMIPSGAVIQGLGISSWNELERILGHEWEIQTRGGVVSRDLAHSLSSRDCILSAPQPAGIKINARYERNDQGQIVLSSLEALS